MRVTNYITNNFQYVSNITDNIGLYVIDYSTFVSLMGGRQFSIGTGYRFRFNGKENDNEVSGNGNKLDFGARIYDSRLGRWLSCDPLEYEYPNVSTYAFAGNSPILYYDPDGNTITIYYETGEKDKDGNIIYKSYDYGSSQKLPKDKFVRSTIKTLDKIQKKGYDKYNIILGLKQSSSNIIITQKKSLYSSSFSIDIALSKVTDENGNDKSSSYDIKDLPTIISWRTDEGLISPDEKKSMCSAKVLLHELGHKYYTLFDPDGNMALNQNCQTYEELDECQKHENEVCGDYSNFSDKWIITKVENGSFKRNWSRNNHIEGYFLKTRGGTFSKKGKEYGRWGQSGLVKELKKGIKTVCKGE